MGSYREMLYIINSIFWAGVFSLEHWYKYLIVTLTCTVKYFAGVLYAGIEGLNFWEIWAFGTLGGIIGIVVFSYTGSKIRHFYHERRKKKRESINYRRAKKWYLFWKKYGIWGMALISPFISPMVSVFVSLAFSESPARIIRVMGSAILLWSLVLALLMQIR